MRPLIYIGGLSGRVFCTTDYRTVEGQPVEVRSKHDVTEQVIAAAQLLGWTPPLVYREDDNLDVPTQPTPAERAAAEDLLDG